MRTVELVERLLEIEKEKNEAIEFWRGIYDVIFEDGGGIAQDEYAQQLEFDAEKTARYEAYLFSIKNK